MAAGKKEKGTAHLFQGACASGTDIQSWLISMYKGSFGFEKQRKECRYMQILIQGLQRGQGKLVDSCRIIALQTYLLDKTQTIHSHAQLVRSFFQTVKPANQGTLFQGKIFLSEGVTADGKTDQVQAVQTPAESAPAATTSKSKTGKYAPGGREEPDPDIILLESAGSQYKYILRKSHYQQVTFTTDSTDEAGIYKGRRLIFKKC